VPSTARHPTDRPVSRGGARARTGPARRVALVLTAAVTLIAGFMPAAVLGAHDATDAAPDAGLQPTIHYEEAMAHASDRTPFLPGGRVTVPFKPRAADRWAVGGVRPQELPAGRASGRAIRDAATPPGQGPVPGRAGDLGAIRPAGAGTGVGTAVGAVDLPYLDPSAAIPVDLAAAVDPGGLKREVFGWLPYWELTDSSTRLDWQTLSTIAYFGVGAAGNGDLQRKNADGSTTVGWSGWTSSKMTSVINTAHANGTRVVLTIQSFAWTASGVTRQKALLGSPANRANLARQIAAAVRDRGADGVNLDFEPIVSTYADEFTALVRTLRAELDKIHKGYQLTFDTTGWIGNYPLEQATAPGAADAVVIMGYDYRTSSTKLVGSVAPIGGPTYDVTDTVVDFLSRLPASKVILGVPYYGRAWSTSTDQVHASNISGTKYGASASVVYGTAVQYAADHGRRWDPVDGVAWTAYRRQNCTAAYGCVNPWRQLYYDDAQALGLKYDLINRYNLRGAGIWALGYDGTRPELYAMLKAKFITDKIPPKITGATVTSGIISPNGDGRLDSTTISVAVTGHLSFGWSIQPMIDGAARPSVNSGSRASKTVVLTWDGKASSGAVVPDGLYRVTIWTADASNNRAQVQRFITVDRRPAAVALRAVPSFVSPNGDGISDTTMLSMQADSAVTGSARILDRRGVSLRKWTFNAATSGSWAWNGRDSAGRVVPDGRYTLRVQGLDRAGNQTIRDLRVTVDRTIKSVRWSRASFAPARKQTATVTFAIGRPATVTVSIDRAGTVVRGIWSARPLAAGTYSWTWNGRTRAGALLAPGTYRVSVTAVSWIGSSSFARTIVITR
jgi:spore germination protein YaaH/flagellar hook assembly protein FlgD